MEPMGEWLFKRRSFTPVPVIAVFVLAARPTWTTFAAGLPVVILGELLRAWSVAYAGLGTRGRTIGAEELVSWGAYAHVRNPIYVANFLLCVGCGVMAGLAAPSWRGAVGLAAVGLFAFQYAAIVAAEERWLSAKFGPAFEVFRATVPRWIPQVARGGAAAPGRPRWREAARSERDTILGILAILAYVAARIYWPRPL